MRLAELGKTLMKYDSSQPWEESESSLGKTVGDSFQYNVLLETQPMYGLYYRSRWVDTGQYF